MGVGKKDERKNMAKRRAAKWHRRYYFESNNEKQASIVAEMHGKFTCCLAVIGMCQAVITWANGTTWANVFFFSHAD